MEDSNHKLTYKEVKRRYIGLNAALDYAGETREADIARLMARVDELAEKFFPEYDRDFFHQYYDKFRDPSLIEDEEKRQFFYDCEDAYEDASSIMAAATNEGDITARYKKTKRRIARGLRDLARQAVEICDDGLWLGERWEVELKRWVDYEEQGPYIPL